MDIMPVLITGLDGLPVTPANSADLVILAKESTAQTLAKESTAQTLAKESTAQALLAAIQALPQPSTRIHRVTVSLASALVDQPVNLGTLTRVHSVTVADLTGTVVPTMKANGAGETAFPLAKGEVRDGLNLTAMLLSCAAGGGSLVLEIHGR